MPDNAAKTSSPALLVAAGAAIVFLVAALGVFAWYEHRRFERLEQMVESMRREPPASAPAAAPAVIAPEPAPPGALSEQGVRFAMATDIRSSQIGEFRAIHEDWNNAVATAARDGERALPRPLAELARKRKAALEKLLGPEMVKRVLEFEAHAPVRATFTAADGKTYRSVEFE